MFVLLQIVSVLLVAVALALAVAHALELPGKLRLDREQYNATQSIYFPVFTVAGLVCEVGALGTTLLLVLATPADSGSLGWTIASFLSLAAMHGAYWTITHRANQFWLVRTPAPTIAPVGFFATHPLPLPPVGTASWSRLRARWEYSHVIRAVLGCISIVALAAGLAID